MWAGGALEGCWRGAVAGAEHMLVQARMVWCDAIAVCITCATSEQQDGTLAAAGVAVVVL
jgi:hypothetical protein